MKILLIIITLLFSACTFKNTPHMEELTQEALQKETHEGIIYKDVLYKSTLFYDLHLDIYEPLKASTKPVPVYIYIHGGSWLRGNKNLVNLYDKTILALRKAGVAVVSIDYRFVSEAGIKAMVEDCADAVTFLQDNATKYNLNMKRLALHGHSAGGNLALVTGFKLQEEGNHLLFIADEYGPTDAVRLMKEKENAPWWSSLIPDSSLELISPIRQIPKTLPPMYIAHGDKDVTVPISHSEALYKAVKAQHGEVTFQVVHGAQHGYAGVDDKTIATHRQEVLAFMLKRFKTTL